MWLCAAQVVSLHALGGPMAGCCAASFGASIAVYSTAVKSGEVPKPKAVWPAHPQLVTTLHRSAHGVHLLSGAQDGSIHMCGPLILLCLLHLLQAKVLC